MEEAAKYAVGIDVGTENVRAVVLCTNRDGMAVVGYGETKNSGMRKGVVANLHGPSEAIDRMLAEVERMSNHQVNHAYISINGAHVASMNTSGMVAVGVGGQSIDFEDLNRVKNSAVTGRIPANREVLAILPLDYTLDGQSGIKDPVGMTGARLEISANVVSALKPNCNNLRKVVDEMVDVRVMQMVPSVMAAGVAVLSEKQRENGVAVIDLGAATTSVAVYEEGDLQYLGVVPLGSNNITNDLAICLQIDTDSAEDIKLRFVTADFPESDKDITVKRGREEITFSRSEVNEIVKARMTEIFHEVSKHLRTAGYERRLPEGVVLVGGGAKMRGIDGFAKLELQTAVKIGRPSGLAGVAESIENTEFAAATGLAVMAARDGQIEPDIYSGKTKNKMSFIKKIFKGF